MRRVLLMLVLCSSLAPAFTCEACGHDSRLRHELELVHDVLLMYRNNTGRFPHTDRHTSWLDTLVDEGWLRGTEFRYLRPLQFRTGARLVDENGRSIVVEMHEPDAAHPTPRVIVRCLGANGFDEQGGGDDWDLRYGPNWGYWYKRGYPAATRIFILTLCAVVILFALLDRGKVWARLWLVGPVLIVGVMWSLLTAHPDLMRRATFAPDWIERAWHGALLTAAAWLLFTILLPFVIMARATGPIEREYISGLYGECRKCRYSRKGSRSDRCPECGTLWSSSKSSSAPP